MQPFKCPVCNATGRVGDSPCPACHGTCVVWGPPAPPTITWAPYVPTPWPFYVPPCPWTVPSTGDTIITCTTTCAPIPGAQQEV